MDAETQDAGGDAVVVVAVRAEEARCEAAAWTVFCLQATRRVELIAAGMDGLMGGWVGV